MTPGTAVAQSRGRDVAVKQWDVAYRELVKRTVLKPGQREASDLELALFAEQAQRAGLDPFMRQIFGVFRYDGRAGGEVMTVQVSIDGLRLIAERSGKYEGQTAPEWCGEDGQWTDVWLKDTPPAAARVGVFKSGHREPLYGVATWREFVQTKKDGTPTAMWQRMRAHMLSKCAEALSLRKAFPAETSGLYTVDEPISDPPVEVVTAIAAPVPVSADPERAAAIATDLKLAVADEFITEPKLLNLLVALGAGDTASIDAVVASTEDLDSLAALVDDLRGADS